MGTRPCHVFGHVSGRVWGRIPNHVLNRDPGDWRSLVDQFAAPEWRTSLPIAFRLASPHECRKFGENTSGGNSARSLSALQKVQVEAWIGRLVNPTSKWQATAGNRPNLESS